MTTNITPVSKRLTDNIKSAITANLLPGLCLQLFTFSTVAFLSADMGHVRRVNQCLLYIPEHVIWGWSRLVDCSKKNGV
jgi:hypothetical protein